MAALALLVLATSFPVMAATGPEELVHVAPVLSHNGREAPHVCFARGSYRVGDQEVAATPRSFCFALWRPLAVWAGDRLTIDTPPEASAISNQYAARFPLGGLRPCSPVKAGRWACSVPPAPPGARSVLLDIAYPDARALWGVDLLVLPVPSQCGQTPRSENGSRARRIRARYVRCRRARRVAAIFTARGTVPGWHCVPAQRQDMFKCRFGRRELVSFRVAPRRR